MEDKYMKRIVPLTLAALACASFVAPPAFSQTFGVGLGNLNRTEAVLQSRINQGFRSGFLTRAEASNLSSKLARINMLEGRLRMSGGRINWRERSRIQRELAQLNSQINFQLSDSQTRFNRNHRRVGFGGRFWR
jgi:hypothetical protein